MTISQDKAQPTSGIPLSTAIHAQKTPTMTRCLLSVAIVSSLLLVGCGDDDDNLTITDNSNISVKSISQFNKATIDGAFSTADSSTPDAKCDIKIEKVSYKTKGAAGEDATATAALMLPSGDSADCQGDRPILLYAHGTTTDKAYDFSQVGNPQNSAVGEATLIAANFAAQGYIVVAPNYAGYDESDLDYHPYLVAEQQSTDMIDALESARDIIDAEQSNNNANYTNIEDSGELFISGYSQGGHVAMATARALEQDGKTVTAIAPLSGPYALAAFGDFIFRGNVNIGATRFAPLLAIGLQKKYNIYQNPSEIFTSNYANTKLPNILSFDELVKANKLPEFALFERIPNDPTLVALPPSNLPFAPLGFDTTNYLINTNFRAAFIEDSLANPDGLIPTVMNSGKTAANPQNPLRKALKDNDLRSYRPNMPTLLCGGNQDPTVFYDLNTGAVNGLLRAANILDPSARNINVTILDVDATNEDKRPNQPSLVMIGKASMNAWDIQAVTNDVQSRFAAKVQSVQTTAYTKAYTETYTKALQDGKNQTEANALAVELATRAAGAAFLGDYHGSLVSTACTQATRQFFEQNFVNVANPV